MNDAEIDDLVVAIKARLKQATINHSVTSKSDPLLSDQLYTWVVNDDDVRGLLHYILDVTSHPSQTHGQRRLDSSPDFNSTDQCHRISGSMPPVLSGPATTISMPEPSFILDGRVQRKRPSSTTATRVSPNKVTETTWQANLSRRETADDLLHSPVDSNVGRLSPDTSSDETMRGSQITPDRRPSTESSGISNGLGQDKRNTQQRNSMVVTTNTNEPAQQAADEVEEAEENPSFLKALRRKSVRLGHAIGSFMNGDYRNADHKPRRESTVIRLRSALDHIEPSRPKQDAAIFSAFTGAQPIGVVDQYHARRPGPPSNTCSEDGR